MKVSGIALIVSVFLLGVFCTLVFTLPQADTMPGSFAFTFKYFKENVQRIQVRDSYDRALFDVELCGRRVDEFEYAYNRTMPKYYEQILLRYEVSLLRAANETSAAYEVAEFCGDAMLVFEKHRYNVWDPPLQERFEAARLTTVKARREALDRISATDQTTTAQLSLQSAGYHLGEALAVGNPDLAKQPLLDYTGWLMYLRGLGLDIYNETEHTLDLDEASRPYMYEHLGMLNQLNRSPSNLTQKHAQNALNISKTMITEMEMRIEEVAVLRNLTLLENVTVEPGLDNETGEPVEPTHRQVAEGLLYYDLLIPDPIIINQSTETKVILTAVDHAYTVTMPSLKIWNAFIGDGGSKSFILNVSHRGSYIIQCADYCTQVDEYGYIKVE